MNIHRVCWFTALVIVSLYSGAWAEEKAGIGPVPLNFEVLQADAVYLEQKDVYTLKEDGSQVHRRSSQVRLQSHFAFHRLLGESFILYNPKFQTLKVHRSMTTMRDGKEVHSTDNAYNEVLPGFCRNAPPYMHLREMVVTHLGLEVGAVIHLDYEIVSKADFYPFLMGEAVFSTPFPLEKKTVVVKVPADVELKSRLLNHEGYEPAVAEEGGFKTYTWSLTDLPPAPPEAMAQNAADYAPYLVFSTCPSWSEAAGILNQRMASAAWLDEESEQKVRDLVDRTTGPLEQVLAINRFVVEEVGNAPVPCDLLGYRLLQAKEIYRHNVGCAMDKCALLVSMLRRAGYFAEPVLVARNRAVAEDVPSWHPFDEWRVLCTLRQSLDQPLVLEEPPLLSPVRMVDGLHEDALAGRTVFRFSLLNNQLMKVPASNREKNRVKADLNLALDEKRGVTGKVRLEVKGALSPYLTLAEDNEGWASRKLGALLPGAKIGEVKADLLRENRSVFRGNTKSPLTLEEEHGLIRYLVPGCPGGVMDLKIPVAPEQRFTPLWLRRAVTEELHLSMSLPESMAAAVLPEPVEINNGAGTLMSGAWVDEGVLHMRRKISLKQYVPPEDYPALRELVIAWSAEDARRIVLKEE
jgi:hypothetical protein